MPDRGSLERLPVKPGLVLPAAILLPVAIWLFPAVIESGSGGGVEQVYPDSQVTSQPDDAQAPSAPGGLVATGVTQTTVTLSWKASSDNVGVTGYRLYEFVKINPYFSHWVMRQAEISGPSVMVTGLKPGSTHRYAVAAVDGAGNESARSVTLRVRNLRPPLSYHPIRKGDTPVRAKIGKRFTYEVDAIGVPSPAFSLVAGPKGMGVDSSSGMVQWTPMAGDEGIVTATVRARNSEGRDDHTFSFRVHPGGTDLEPPSVVRNPVVTKITSAGGTLTWNPATDNVGVAGYLIKAQQNGRGHSSFIAGKSVGPGTTCLITNLKPGTGYRIWVVAYDAADNVAPSSGVAPAKLTTLPAPDSGDR